MSQANDDLANMGLFFLALFASVFNFLAALSLVAFGLIIGFNSVVACLNKWDSGLKDCKVISVITAIIYGVVLWGYFSYFMPYIIDSMTPS